MSDKNTWTIEVKGPSGVRVVAVADEDVKRYFGTNPYVSAAWLAGWKIQKDVTDVE